MLLMAMQSSPTQGCFAKIRLKIKNWCNRLAEETKRYNHDPASRVKGTDRLKNTAHLQGLRPTPQLWEE